MSHQTGIHANEDLLKFFGTCRDGRVRVIKIGIHDEQLTLDDCKETEGSWDSDYTKHVLSTFVEKQPCYLLFRLDSQNEMDHEWLFISWSPDDSPLSIRTSNGRLAGPSCHYRKAESESPCAQVREKMLYASTKATLKKEFGSGQIKDELFATIKEELNVKAVQKIIRGEKSPPPLTSAEEELKQIKKSEVDTDVSLNSKQQVIQGLAFPISADAMQALTELKEGIVTYVQLSIDLDNELINSEMKGVKDVHSLSEIVPKNHGRYHLFTFPHSFEGEHMISIVFIYSIPGDDCSVKERMLYSSCKLPLLDTIENVVGIPIARKIEMDDPTSLNETFLIDELHPKKIIFKQKFAKPKGPGRGVKRLIKSPPTEIK